MVMSLLNTYPVLRGAPAIAESAASVDPVDVAAVAAAVAVLAEPETTAAALRAAVATVL